jgi:hypothetical protein
MDSRFVVYVQRQDGSVLFSAAFTMLDNNGTVAVRPQVIPAVSTPWRLSEEKLTASLFWEMPQGPADGRGLYPGGVRVACIFNMRDADHTSDAVVPGPPPSTHRIFDRPDEEAEVTWMRNCTNSVLDKRGIGRVHVFSNRLGYVAAPSFEADRGRGEDYPCNERHIGRFAVLVHVPADGGALYVWPTMKVKYDDYPDGEPFGALEPLKEYALALFVKDMKWRDC